MKQSQRSVIFLLVVGVVFIFGLGGAAFYYLQNKADASVIGSDGTTCPQLVAVDPNSCAGGTLVASTPSANGCPMPPKCVTTMTVAPSITATTACGTSPVAGSSASPCIAPPTKTPTICPMIASVPPNWCSDGTVQQQPNDANGCPQPPKCIRDKVTFNLNTGWNVVVMPEYMYGITDPISSSAFSGMTMYNYSNENWQLNPQYIRQHASYLVKNKDSAKSITVQGSGMHAVGVYNGQQIYKGWNMMANNSESPKLLSEVTYKTYVPDPDCHTMPACGEFKSLANLFTEGRIYTKIFFFNDLTSSDPNTFYATKILSEADLSSYRVPAKSAFWVYLFR